MAIKLGDKDISKIMLGDRPIKKVMLGDRLAWESYQGNIIKGTTIQSNQTLTFALNGANISVTSNNNGEWEYRTTDTIQRLKFNTTTGWQVALKSVDLSKVDFSSLITTDEMFLRCAKVQEIKGFSWIPNTISGFTSTFNGFSRDTPYLTSLDLSRWEINGTTTAMFAQGGLGLSDLRIGKIFVTLNFSTMPLNLQSAIGILDALQPVTTAQTITFSAYTSALIMDDDTAMEKVMSAMEIGWNIVLN